MSLDPDLNKLYYSETDVRPAVPFSPRAAYDVALYTDKSGPPKGVLVITICLQYRFEDGVSEQAATQGQKLTWTQQEKEEFALRFRAACYYTWSDRFRIIRVLPYWNGSDLTDIGVMINIKNVVDEPTIHDHWELTIKKTDIFMVSGVYPRKKVADLDSLDLNPDHKGGSKQRAAVHEFGHMLGFREEYPNPNETKEDGTPKRDPTDFTDAWTLDEESVMYNGETVRERHYAPFAGWLNKVFAVTLEKDGYKVAGLWTVSNSKL